MNFRCIVTDNSGNMKNIIRQAPSRESLISALLKEGITPLKISEINLNKKDTISSLSVKKLVEFTSTLSLLMESGLSIKDSILMLKDIISDKAILNVINYIDDRLNKGDSFSQIISEMDKTFPPLYRGLITIGDRIGNLRMILPALTSYLHRNKKIKDKIINASIYPAIVFFISIIGLIFISLFIIPRFQLIFSNFAGSSMQLEQINNNITIFSIFTIIIASLLFLILVLFFACRFSDNLKRYRDYILIKLPLVGTIIKTLEIFNFIFAVEILSSNGFSLSDAMRESLQVSSNIFYKNSFRRICNKMSTGTTLYKAFSNEKIIPRKVVQWARLGESTGNIEKVFTQLRIYYETEVENIVTRMMSLIEPVLILLVGTTIIILVILFVIPIFSIFGTML